jgi:hypothetical protein
MEITLLPLLIFIIGLMYLQAKTRTPIFGLFAGLICLYIVLENAENGNMLFLIIFAGMFVFLTAWAVRDVMK